MKTMKTVILPRSEEVLDKLDLDVPRSWNDLSKKQVLKVCSLFKDPREKQSFMVSAAMDLLGLKLKSYHRTHQNNLFLFTYKGKKIVIDADQLRFICNHFEFILQESNLVENKFPVIKVRLKKFYGPEDKLYNISYDEFRTAENWFLAFSKTKDFKYLDLLVATLYRPKKKGVKINSLDYDGDIREPFNDHAIKTRSKSISKLPAGYKIAVFQFFFGCMNHLKEKFPMVFQGGNGGVTDRVIQSLKVVDWLNGGDVTKNREILKSNIYEVMTRMQTEREKIEQLEKLNKK